MGHLYLMQTFLPPKVGRGLAVALASLLFPLSLKAATVVQWGGDYVSTYQPFAFGTPSSGTGWQTYVYSTTRNIAPVGPKVYGAFSVVNGSGGGAVTITNNRFGYAHLVAGDQMRFGITADGTTGSVTMSGLVFFQKEDFLNVTNDQKVNFKEGGSLSLAIANMLGDNSQQRVRLAVYALVGAEWGWYLSEDSRTSAGTLGIADAGVANWAPYTIDAGTSPLNPSPSVYNVAGAAFEEISAFGFYFSNRATAPNPESTYNATFYTSSFSVDATVVPEPGVALLSVGGLLLLTGRRFWKKQR